MIRVPGGFGFLQETVGRCSDLSHGFCLMGVDVWLKQDSRRPFKQRKGEGRLEVVERIIGAAEQVSLSR